MAIYQIATLFLAVGAVLFLVALGGKLILSPGNVEAASSEKSLLGLEGSIYYANREGAFQFDPPREFSYPFEIGEDVCFVSFPKGIEKADVDGSTILRPEEACSSFVENSCLCIMKGTDCNVMSECVNFEDFDIKMINTDTGEEIGGKKGDGDITNLIIAKVEEKLIIKIKVS